MILYFNDGYIFGIQEDIDKVLDLLSKEFTVKRLGKVEKFVGCHIIESKKGDTMWIHQPKLLQHLEHEFGDLTKNLREFKTPAAPKTNIMRPEKTDILLTEDEQTKYRSGVGMLLYLIKHSRPDLGNAIRELSKVADGANNAHWKALLRAIKYTLDTQFLALRIKPKKEEQSFSLEGYSDSDYAGDKDTRISVYGYIIFYNGAPISWKSKSGKSVTLSSTEAEYFAMSEVVKEIMFAKQVLESMGIAVQLPIIVRVDNVGAIYLSKNFALSQRTKHIDIRRHFVREYVEDDIVKIIFVKSELNRADPFTKNTTEDVTINNRDLLMDDIRKIT